MGGSPSLFPCRHFPGSASSPSGWVCSCPEWTWVGVSWWNLAWVNADVFGGRWVPCLGPGLILGSPVPGAAGSVPAWWDLGLCPGSASHASVSVCHTCPTGQFEEKYFKSTLIQKSWLFGQVRSGEWLWGLFQGNKRTTILFSVCSVFQETKKTKPQMMSMSGCIINHRSYKQWLESTWVQVTVTPVNMLPGMTHSTPLPITNASLHGHARPGTYSRKNKSMTH